MFDLVIFGLCAFLLGTRIEQALNGEAEWFWIFIDLLAVFGWGFVLINNL